MSIVEGSSRVKVVVREGAEAAGRAAGHEAADALARTLERQPRARVVFASAPSQEQALRALGEDARIDWSRVQSLHMDDYLGIDPSHPGSFGTWLADRLPAAALPGLDRIRPDVDPDVEVRRYSDVLAQAPIDLVCLGIGVNGHIAFNEPGDTDFEDDALVRSVELTHASRRQQVDEGLFPSLDEVPTHALTMTVPAILSGRALVCTVLGDAKASAVAATITGPITTAVPASAMRTHADVVVHLDVGAARDLPPRLRSVATAQG